MAHTAQAELKTNGPTNVKTNRPNNLFTLKTEYSTPYSALIRENVVMGVPRYFLERWVPTLGTGPATVVNTLRQLGYPCQNDTITISGEALAREAAMSRRHLYTCLETPWIQAFVRTVSGPRIRSNTGKILQQPNQYHIRMDDPLTPSDADHLLHVLTNLADTPLDAARKALELEARSLWAPNPQTPSGHFTEARAINAHDVLSRAFPTWQSTNADQQADYSRLAEALHRHITLVREDGRTSKVIVPQYFRKRWWPHLGHDLAWIYLWLRGYVYDHPNETVRRDTCWIPSLNTLLAIVNRPREWWRRNVEHAKPHPDWSLSAFFEQLCTQKGRLADHPQWVARQFQVTLDIPIAPEDQLRYKDLLTTWQGEPVLPAVEIISNASPEKEPVRHNSTHRSQEGLPHSNTPTKKGSSTVRHTGETGVCHVPTQGSATSEHRKSQNLKKASSKQKKHLITSKQPSPGFGTQQTAAGIQQKKNYSLVEQFAQTLKCSPDSPLWQAASVETWLEQTWKVPIQPHTPVWTISVSGQIPMRDIVALILSVWADTSIKQPARYLSWLVQRWQTQPDMLPISQWERWRKLADMPLAKWNREGKQLWLELAPTDNRALPFGLDDVLADPETVQQKEVADLDGPAAILPHQDQAQAGSSGLDEHPQNSTLSINDIWLATLGQLSLQLNRSTYSNWVEGAKAVSYADGVLTVRAKHIMAHKWLSQRLNHAIEDAASKLAQTPITIHYVYDPPNLAPMYPVFQA